MIIPIDEVIRILNNKRSAQNVYETFLALLFEKQ